MFHRLNRTDRKKQQKQQQKHRRRKNVSRNNRMFGEGRSLRMESLEDRRVLALLGVAPLDLPIVSYNVDGTTTYDATTDIFSIDATPFGINSSANPAGFFFSGDLDINIEVDDTGTLVGGVLGDDFVLFGDVDIDGDFVVDESGVLLTGEILGFGSEDSAGTIDLYDFRFSITGGLLTTNPLTSAAYLGKDIGVTTISESSTFTGDFTVNFNGNAKGDVGTIDPIAQNPAIDIEKLTNGINADDPVDAPIIVAGDAVTFTYQVTNTGDVAFAFADVEVVDDNGTPGDLGDDLSTTSGDIVLVPTSDVGGDLILSPGETWEYEYSTVAQDLGAQGLSSLVSDGTYQLGNHPDGNAGPPTYGLRLDGLTTYDDSDIFTFSFDQADGANVQMVIDGDDITISGTVFGGRVVNNAYVVGESGLWNLSFSYSAAMLAAGDDDLQVDDLLAGTNTGSITKLFGDLASFDLVDYSGSRDFSFQLGNEDNDLGHRGFAGISGWGWMNHAPSNDPAWLNTHQAASDWLFTAKRIGIPNYENFAVVTALGVTDTDLSHYRNPNAAIDLEKLTNGVDADDPLNAPKIAPGDTVTFTYQVTNTGESDFNFADIVIVDDNGTPNDTNDDLSTTAGDIVFLPASDVGSDLILSVGETWEYEFVTTANDLTIPGPSISVDFDTLSAGDILDVGNQPFQAGFGLTIESLNASNPAMVFDSNNPTGGDTDLATPGTGVGNTTALNNLLILSEDGDQSDPDDNAGGGTLVFAWEDTVTIDTVTLVDIDANEANGSISLFDADGVLIGSVVIPSLGDNSVQTLDVNVDGVAKMEIYLVSSGAVAEVVFNQPAIGVYENFASVWAPDADDTDLSHYTNPVPIVMDPPHIAYNNGGTVNYNSTTDVFSIDATPLTIGEEINPAGFFFSGDFDISFIVDDTGALVAGVAGDDLVLVGDVDVDGDFLVDFSGILLTGEVIEFSSTDSGGTTDTYESRFMVTGGLLAPFYAGQDLLVMTTSEGSDFTGDFTVDFGGNAKGDIWPEASQADLKASLGNYVFIDNDGNGLQNTGDQGINGITVNLLNDQNMVVASTVTNFDGNGNAGFYLFYNLAAGDYIVEFDVPEGVTFTTQDAGDDTLDSDVNVTTKQTDVITLAEGEHRRNIDAGVTASVMVDATVYQIQNYVNYYQNKRAGKVKSIDMEFSSDLDELYVSIDFKAYRGRLTDGFTIVITGGEWPAGTADKFAIFYFDADIRNRNGGPVLNVLGYNGKYNAQSFRDSDGNSSTYDPDRIATSLDNSSGWVKDLQVDTYRVNGRWQRTMSFRIVASTVNNFVNLEGGNWEGAQFGTMASFAIDTYDGLYTKYNNDGFLKKWKYRRHGWMDGDWVATTEEKIWQEVSIQDFLLDFNWVVTDYVEGSSDGDPPLDANDEISDFDWAGSVDAAMDELFV